MHGTRALAGETTIRRDVMTTLFEVDIFNLDFAVSTPPQHCYITQGVRLQGTVETTQAARLPTFDTDNVV